MVPLWPCLHKWHHHPSTRVFKLETYKSIVKPSSPSTPHACGHQDLSVAGTCACPIPIPSSWTPTATSNILTTSGLTPATPVSTRAARLMLPQAPIYPCRPLFKTSATPPSMSPALRGREVSRPFRPSSKQILQTWPFLSHLLALEGQVHCPPLPGEVAADVPVCGLAVD